MTKKKSKNRNVFTPSPPTNIEIELDEVESNETDEQEWSADIEDVLQRIHDNATLMSKYHKGNYLTLKGNLVYFRIPLIILGGANSVFAVGLTAYLKQQSVSLINCLLSLICAIITSVELFLGIQAGMERELTSQRDYYLMAVDINSVLSLDRRHRTVNGKRYLEKILSDYNKLFSDSEVIKGRIEDKLVFVKGATINPKSEKLSEIIVDSPTNNNLSV
ncbi:hypothetical protein [Dishui Lake virophage 2]|nr:hypothetical protein [Dishui Lake virophage 2]